MKKSDALKYIQDTAAKDIVKPLERLNLYYLTAKIRTGGFFSVEKESKPIPVMITHFYQHGIKVKVLINNSGISHNGFFHIRYERIQRYKFTEMPAEDLPLFAGVAHPNMGEAFKRAKPFRSKRIV